MKKILSVVLMMGMVVMLFSGCSAFDTRATRAMMKFIEADSFHLDTTLDVAVNMDFDGEIETSTVTMEASSDIVRYPGKMKTELRMTADGETAMLGCVYFENQKDQLLVYTSNASDGWDTYSIQKDVAESSNQSERVSKEFLKTQFGALLDVAKSFNEVGIENVGNYEATVYAGTITAENLLALVKSADLDNGVLESSGINLNDIDAAKLGNIDIKIWIENENDRLVKAQADFSEILQSIIVTPMEADQEDSEPTVEDADIAEDEANINDSTEEDVYIASPDMNSFNLDISVEKAVLDIVFSSYNEVETFELPVVDEDSIMPLEDILADMSKDVVFEDEDMLDVEPVEHMDEFDEDFIKSPDVVLEDADVSASEINDADAAIEDKAAAVAEEEPDVPSASVLEDLELTVTNKAIDIKDFEKDFGEEKESSDPWLVSPKE